MASTESRAWVAGDCCCKTVWPTKHDCAESRRRKCQPNLLQIISAQHFLLPRRLAAQWKFPHDSIDTPHPAVNPTSTVGRGRNTSRLVPTGGRRQSPTSGSLRTQHADFLHWARQKLIHSLAIACNSGLERWSFGLSSWNCDLICWNCYHRTVPCRLRDEPGGPPDPHPSPFWIGSIAFRTSPALFFLSPISRASAPTSLSIHLPLLRVGQPDTQSSGSTANDGRGILKRMACSGALGSHACCKKPEMKLWSRSQLS
jgi:hypothetical protein